MKSIATPRWIEAGKTLAADPEVKVACPECGKADLRVTDYKNEENPAQFERIMQCPLCGARNVLRMTAKEHS
jgi:predicted RNA-binding Zn-ribbon protein involved in translation (DUF1610 family)